MGKQVLVILYDSSLNVVTFSLQKKFPGELAFHHRLKLLWSVYRLYYQLTDNINMTVRTHTWKKFPEIKN